MDPSDEPESQTQETEAGAAAAASQAPCQVESEPHGKEGGEPAQQPGAECADERPADAACGAPAINGDGAAGEEGGAAAVAGSSLPKTPGGRPQREDPAALERLRAYVASLGGTLPPGWVCVCRTRMTGSSAGQHDLVYRNPEGRMVRSRAEVLRILGLDPSGGAAAAAGGAGAGGASAKKAGGGKGSRSSKKAAAAPQQAPQGQEAAGGTAAALAGGATGRAPQGGLASPGAGPTTTGAKWTLPLELSREEAVAAARERAEGLGLKPPFMTDRGVTVLALGSFHKAYGFYDATHIWPLGYRAAWLPPHDPSATTTTGGGRKKAAKSTTPVVVTVPAAAAGADDTNMEENTPIKALAEAASPADGAAAVTPTPAAEHPAAPMAPLPYRFISEIREAEGSSTAAGVAEEGEGAVAATTTTSSGPSFVILLEPNPDASSTGAGALAVGTTEPLLVHSAASPDAAWSAIPELQTAAAALCKRAKPSGAGVQPAPWQRALAAMPAVRKVWGPDCFGLSDVRVLQLLEVLPGVAECSDYVLVQQRHSWELESTAITTKRNVVLSAAPNRRAAAAANKQRKRQQQLSIEAFVDRSGLGTAEGEGAGAENGEGGPAPEKGEAAEREGVEGGALAAAVDGAEAKKAARRKSTGGGGGGRKGGKNKEESEIHAVLDRLVERVSVVMAEPDEKARQKMIKAMEKADRAAARKREKAAAEREAAAGGTTTSGAATTTVTATTGAAVDKKPSKPPKAPAKAAKEAATAEAAAAATAPSAAATQADTRPAAAASPQQLPTTTPPTGPVDERTLSTAGVPAPSGLPLALSYPTAAAVAALGSLSSSASSSAAASGAGCEPVGLVAPGGEPCPAERAAGGVGMLSSTEMQQLLSVYQFIWDHRKLLGLEGRVPSLGDLLVVVSEAPAHLPAPARRLADDLHLALVRLLVGEVLEELMTYVAETSNLGRRDLSAASPPITAATWPELARRYLAAAAAARYLATSEPRSSALAALQLPGQMQNLEPADWLHYLLSGLNFPHLLSRIALLPHASSRWAADALLAEDDARARAAAERQLLMGTEGGEGVGEGADLQELDGEGQVRRGRRLLHALLSLPEGGSALGFFAPEFASVMKAPRGVDLRAVAARLDAGMYQSTDDWLAALASDVRGALSLWRTTLVSPKARDIPGHQDSKASLADIAERKLDELLANADIALALPQPPSAAAAAAGKASAGENSNGDVELGEAGGSSGAAAGGKGSGSGRVSGGGSAGGKSRKRRGKRKETEEGGEEEGVEEGGEDPVALDDPTRLFNPRAGCRVCWLDEDKNRILLCDGCDGEYHCYCVEPPLLEVPEGAWFCPSCTARGLAPKADDEGDTEAMEVDGGAGRGSTPHRTGSSGGAGTSSRAPCSPAFQHCHSHSHLVSELHDRAAPRRLGGAASAIAMASASGALGNGLNGRAVSVPVPPAWADGAGGVGEGRVEDEAPLRIPGDVPEGPRVTLGAHSRPGLQELAGLLRLAHLLGNYDYTTGACCVGTNSMANANGGGGVYGGACGWTPSRRLALLCALCELAADTNALRNSLEEVVEARKKARAEALALRSKARQIQEEQLAAKKAAAEKENTPKPEPATGNGATEANGVVAAGGGGKGGAKPGGKAGGKAGGKVAAETAALDGMGEGEDGAGQDGKDAEAAGGKGASSRNRVRRNDLSVLPEADLKRLMALEAQVEGMSVRLEALGEDRHGSRYWWLGADLLDPRGPHGVVLAELMPPGQVAAAEVAATADLDQRVKRLQREEAERRRRQAAEDKKTTDTDGQQQQQQLPEEELDEWGLPKNRPRPRIVAIGSDIPAGRSWGLFHTPEQLKSLLDWLNPRGMREGPLRTSLLRACERLTAAHAGGGGKLKQSAAAVSQPPTQPLQQASVEGALAIQAPPPPPPLVLCPVATLATSGGGGRRGVRQGSVVPQDSEDAAADVDGAADARNGMVEAVAASPEALALRGELLSLYRGLPAEALSRFWGSSARQARWCSFVERAVRPQQCCAALTVLESMLVDEAMKPHWRLYYLPAQHPELCTTWAAAWYRLGALQGALRKQIIPPRELHHQSAVAAETVAHAGGKAAGRAKEGTKQAAAAAQERYPSRRGAAVMALPDISNVRSREAAALLRSSLPAADKGKKDTGSGKRQRADSGEENEEQSEEEEDERRGASKQRVAKRQAAVAAKGVRSRQSGRESQRHAVAEAKSAESDGDEDAEEEEEEGEEGDSDDEAAGSGSDQEGEEEEEESEEGSEGSDASEEDEEEVGRRRPRASRASARIQKKERSSRRSTRSSSRLQRKGRDEENESDDDEEEEEVPPAKRTRGGAAAAKVVGAAAKSGAGARRTMRGRGAVLSSSSEEEEEEDTDAGVGKEAVRGSAGQQARATRGAAPAAPVAKPTANGAKAAVGSRAAAIMANRKRAISGWSEDDEDGSGNADGSGGSSSNEEERPAAATRTRVRLPPSAKGTAPVRSRARPQQADAARKAPPRRSMARSEVEYDVEDFDDLNT